VPTVSSQSLDYAQPAGRRWRRLILTVLLALGIAGIVLVGSVYLLVWYLFGEKWFSTRSANVVVAAVMNHTLAPNAAGIVTLPTSMASYSQDGRVYVTVDSAGATWILFPTARSKGDNLQAYVYDSAASNAPPPAEMTLSGPDLSPVGAAPVTYTVDQKVDANWYHVFFDMD
jgi:hypothetical protein